MELNRFFKGLLWAIPLSLVMWAVIYGVFLFLMWAAAL
jgi:hypothetical protein